MCLWEIVWADAFKPVNLVFLWVMGKWDSLCQLVQFGQIWHTASNGIGPLYHYTDTLYQYGGPSRLGLKHMMGWCGETHTVIASMIYLSWSPEKMTGEPDSLDWYRMVTPFRWLQHDYADLFHTLNVGLQHTSNSDNLLSWIGKHIPCLALNPCTFSYSLDLATNNLQKKKKRTTLTSRDHQLYGVWRCTGSCVIGHKPANEVVLPELA